jgi:hypothetical protein
LSEKDCFNSNLLWEYDSEGHKQNIWKVISLYSENFPQIGKYFETSPTNRKKTASWFLENLLLITQSFQLSQLIHRLHQLSKSKFLQRVPPPNLWHQQ